MTTIEIIAEVGVNHNGKLTLAKQLIQDAKDCGCDTVKFQLFHGDRYPEFQIGIVDMRILKALAEKIGLRFLCTPDDIEDARALDAMGCERIKIGSSNLTNLPLLNEIASYELPVILSTGASEMNEIVRAANCFKSKLTIMHCVSAYPPPADQMNLRILSRLHTIFGGSLGLSDHTPNNATASLVALGFGARTFEKHFTLDHHLVGPDHVMSLDFKQMNNYVVELRRAAEMLGDGIKRIMPCEVDNRREYEQFVLRQVNNADNAAT